MIKAEIDFKDRLFFEIKGHAESGPYGQDLVCAAVTGIVSGMLNVFDTRFQGQVKIDVNENLILVKCDEPTRGSKMTWKLY